MRITFFKHPQNVIVEYGNKEYTSTHEKCYDFIQKEFPELLTSFVKSANCFTIYVERLDFINKISGFISTLK